MCLLIFSISVISQNQNSLGEKLIIDPAVRYGKLANGLTYYVRHNEMPKERAEFYIVHKVGSIQEEDNQRGLAHFLEHMAFNGSKHFPSKKGIQEYVESIGMRMGENLNAYTGFDETVYMLMNVPVTSDGIIDSCMLILHDWSSFLLLDDEAIEKERGVVREEWRSNSTSHLRVMEQQLPKMFPRSKYGTRIPIGSIEVIENFEKAELEAFYKKWYRPDLQAVIIVGDIDVDKIEAKIKKMFSDIPVPVNPEPLELSFVPDNNRPIVSIAKDKEMTNAILSIYHKHDIIPVELKGTLIDLITTYTQSVISLIMSERFSEIAQKPDSPFSAAYASDGYYSHAKTKGAWSAMAMLKDGDIELALRALVAETERVKKFGFTEAEYERAKDNILKRYESAYNERDKNENSSLAEDYMNHFTDGDYIPGIEGEYKLIEFMVNNYSLENVNSYVGKLFNENDKYHNLVISLTGPDIEGLVYPTEEELLMNYVEVSKVVVTAKDEEVISKILIPVLPEPGKIISEQEDTLFGATFFTLSNGVRVVVKQTEYKKDEILMAASSPGGQSMFKDDKDIWNLKVINNAIMQGGLGEFSAINLSKALAGKNISCRTGLGPSNEMFSGTATPSDLKTLFEIIYLQFTGMRVDDDAYTAYVERIKSQLDNLYLNPMVAFSDTLTGLAYNFHPRNDRLKSSDFEKIDYHRMIDMYKERYADASDFVFTFVGNVDKDSIRPLLEQYLATLPSLNRKEKADEEQITPFSKGKITKHIEKKLETPKTTVGLMYTGKMQYNLKNYIITQLLGNILDLVFLEKVREEESATYSIQTYIMLYDFPEGTTSAQIYFDTDPEKQDYVINIVKTEFEHIAKEGPVEEYLNICRNSMNKGRVEMMQKNDYWLNVIDAYYFRNFDSHSSYSDIINSITAEDIKSFTKEFLNQGNEIEVVMYPAPDNDIKE